ncbi:Lar family restriction alleviation protein [Sphingobium yanoikuyae]|nr:Lar family restriction alleviation protein [Sphingobium yanoikuyae]
MTKPNEPEALEPCPFCGAPAQMASRGRTEKGHSVDYAVECAEKSLHCPASRTAMFHAKREWAIAAWNRRATAHPVADAGGVTDADREAAARCVEHGLSRPNPLNVRQGVVDSWHLIQAFARHRLQSVAAATAAKDAEIADLKEYQEGGRQALLASMEEGTRYKNALDRFIEDFENDFVLDGQIVDAPDPMLQTHYIIARAALSEAREAGE